MTTPPTPTPDELVAAIARAVAAGATADDRRAGRHAALLLASTLGEPGEPMTLPGVPPRPPRAVDGAQLLDLAIAKMRAFLAEQEAQAAPPASTSAPTSAPTSSASSARSTAPAPTRPRVVARPLRIPLVGAPSRRP